MNQLVFSPSNIQMISSYTDMYLCNRGPCIVRLENLMSASRLKAHIKMLNTDSILAPIATYHVDFPQIVF